MIQSKCAKTGLCPCTCANRRGLPPQRKPWGQPTGGNILVGGRPGPNFPMTKEVPPSVMKRKPKQRAGKVNNNFM